MPTYSYLNTTTNEEIDINMSIAEMEEFEASNKHMQRIFLKMNIADPAGLGIQKPPSDFSKYVLGKVARVPGADKTKLEKRWSIPREW